MKRQITRTGVVVVVLAATCLAGWVLWDRSGRPSDFSQDYFAARVLIKGESIYGDEVAVLGREHFGAESPGNFHPPTVATAFVPLALLPYRTAFVLFGLFNSALFVVSVRLTARATSLPAGRTVLIGLLWWPFWACLTHGQVSMLVAAALTACWLCDERRMGVAAGAFAGVAVLFKLFPALVALYFLIRGDRRALVSMTGVTVAGFALSLMVVGADDFIRYATVAAPECAARWISHPLNVSLHGAVQALMGGSAWGAERLTNAPESARLLAPILGVAIVAVTAWRGIRSLRDTEIGARRLLAGTCVASLLLSPLSWSHTLVVCLFPLIVEVARSGSIRSRIAVLAVGFLLIGLPGPPLGRLIAPFFSGGSIPWFVTTAFQAPAIGATVLWWRLILGRSSGFRRGHEAVGG